MKQFIFVLIFISISGLSVVAQGKDYNSSFARGVALANNGSFREAVVEFEKVESFAGERPAKRSAQLHFNIGVCHFRLDENAEAIRRFETAIQLFPKYERAHYALGMAASQNRDWKKAERSFLTAISTKKTNGEAWLDLGFVYLATSDFPRARAAFEMAIELNTVDAATAHNNVGVIKASTGDRKGAERSFEDALRISSGTYQIAAANLRVIRESVAQDLVATNFALGKQRNFFGE